MSPVRYRVWRDCLPISSPGTMWRFVSLFDGRLASRGRLPGLPSLSLSRRRTRCPRAFGLFALNRPFFDFFRMIGGYSGMTIRIRCGQMGWEIHYTGDLNKCYHRYRSLHSGFLFDRIQRKCNRKRWRCNYRLILKLDLSTRSLETVWAFRCGSNKRFVCEWYNSWLFYKGDVCGRIL